MLKTLTIASLAILNLTLGGWTASGAGPTTQAAPQAVGSEPKDAIKVPEVTDEQPMSFWMAKKLDYSKSILEALTMGDYKRLAVDAERLRVLGKLEGFVRNRNADYRVQLGTFDLATQELISNAKRERAEGASLAFNHLTNSCVNCHMLLREGVK